jgi:hypothetical protein
MIVNQNPHVVTILVLLVVFAVIQAIALSLRLWSRKKYMNGWRADDWLIIIAFASLPGLSKDIV